MSTSPRLDRDERLKASLLSAWFFLTVAALWLLKSSRVTALLSHLGAREMPTVRLVGIVVVGACVYAYSVAAARLSRIALVRATSAALAAVVLGLWLAVRISGPALGSSRAFIWAFYILVDVYTVVMVELFWTYANDVVTPEEAERLYGVVGLGGILGGIVGGVVVDVCARAIGPDNFLVIGAAIIASIIGLASVTERVLRPPPRHLAPRNSRPASRVGTTARDVVKEIAGSRYMLLLAGLVIAYELSTTLMDFGVYVVLERAHLGEEGLARVYGRIGWIAGAIAIVVQLVVVPRLLPKKRAALLFSPIVLLAITLGVMLAPVLVTALAMGSLGRGLNYSVQQSTRESLYVPLTDEQKYRAKAFIDMFVDRAAKAGASVLLLVLIALGHASPRATLFVSSIAIVGWISSAGRLGTYADRKLSAVGYQPSASKEPSGADS